MSDNSLVNSVGSNSSTIDELKSIYNKEIHSFDSVALYAEVTEQHAI